MDPATISRVARRLEQDTLIETSRPLDDRRVLRLNLTKEGQAIYERTLPRMQARQEALLGALSRGERDAIFEIFEKLEVIANERQVAAQ